MRSSIPLSGHPRHTFALILVLAVFLNLLPLNALAATSKASPPVSHNTVQSQQQEDPHESHLTDSQEKSPQAGQSRSPLAKSPVLKEFREWVEQYKVGGTVAASEQKGKELARQRRAIMAQLVKADPQSAVEAAVPSHVKRKMPAAIQQEVEEQISGYGDYLVMVFDYADPASGEFTRSRTERKVVLNGKTYEASVYGHKVGMTTKMNIPLRGVAMDGVIALAESPVRVLEPEERDSSMGGQGIDAEVGGKVQHFESQEQLESFEEKLKEKELTIGPGDTGATGIEDKSSGMSASAIGDVTPKSMWTEGPKKVLVMRVDFSDKPGESISVANANNQINTECNNFYKTNSYNKTSLIGTVTPTVLRMPQVSTFYTTGTNYTQLMTDARAAAKAAGYDTVNYDLDIVAFKHLAGYNWAGLGYIGGKGTWLNGYFSLRETSHELGHNFGLYHANLWKTTNGTVIGTGKTEEYGDPYDAMGGGYMLSTHHFNTWFKNTLNWVPTLDVQTVTTSGNYQIKAHDYINSTGKRALKIQRDATTFYWVEFRQTMTDFTTVPNGAVIHWGYSTNKQSNLLDMTPNSVGGAGDSPLAIGQTFIDSQKGIEIKAVSKTTTVPATLNVTVTFNTGLKSLTLAPVSVSGGINVTGTVTLGAVAPATGAVVTLSDNIAATTLPASVTIPAGQTSKTFTITTAAITATQSGTVTATHAGVSKTAALSVTPAVPLALSSLTLSPASTSGGNTVTGTVTLNRAAPATGTVVTLSDNIAATTVPVNVTVPSGATSKTFNITTAVVAANQSGTVSAQLGAVIKTAALTVRPPALSSVTLNPASVVGGNSVTGTVNLDGVAPAGGAVVTLSDALPATTTPASVTIPAGLKTQNFTITTAGVTVTQVGSVTASRNGVSKAASLTVRPVGVQSVTVSPNPVIGGNAATGTVVLERAPAANTVVTLSDNLAATTIPASVTVTAGTTTKTFPVTTTAVATNQTGSLTATANAQSRSVTMTVNTNNIQTQLLLNPGFESGAANWVTYDSAIITVIPIINNSTAPYAGLWNAWLGGYSNSSVVITQYLYQDVTIPTNATSANLNFYLYQYTNETATTAQDTLKVQIQNTAGTVLATPATYSNLTPTGMGYAKKTINLFAYKGQRVRVFFLSTSNTNAFYTGFYLDNVTLDITQ